MDGQLEGLTGARGGYPVEDEAPDSMGIFKEWLFTLPTDCPNRREIKRDILESGAKIVKNEPDVFNKYQTTIHLRPRTFTREEALAQGMNLKLVVALEYIRDSVLHEVALDLERYRLFGEEENPLTQAPHESQMNDDDDDRVVLGNPTQPDPQTDATKQVMDTVEVPPHPMEVDHQGHVTGHHDDVHAMQVPTTPTRDDTTASRMSSSRRGAVRGSKLKMWTTDEVQTLVEYIQKQILDDDVLSGMKIWKQAEAQNVLPGRTAQSMRECYRRRELGKVAREALKNGDTSSVTASRTADMNPDAVMERGVVSGIPNLAEIIDHLIESTNRNSQDVFWAIYQTSGDFKKARSLLLGSSPDFAPWSPDEDQLIERLAQGFRAALLQHCNSDGERLNAIVNSVDGGIVNMQDRHDLEKLLYSRTLDECAQRAVFLRQEN